MEDSAAHSLEKFKMIAKKIRVVSKCLNENCTIYKILVEVKYFKFFLVSIFDLHYSYFFLFLEKSIILVNITLEKPMY